MCTDISNLVQSCLDGCVLNLTFFRLTVDEAWNVYEDHYRTAIYLAESLRCCFLSLFISFNQVCLRWPDTIYLREGQLFWGQIFGCSTGFDCWDILDAEKGMLEVNQKRTFIQIDTNIENFQQFSWPWFSKKMRIIGKMKRRFSFILLWTGAGTSKISRIKFQINRLHTIL